jgi:Mitochondrial biogenesis AIM24
MSNFVEPEIVVDVAAEEITALTADQIHLVDPLGSGFTWYTPPMASPGKEHETHGNREWSIAGHDMQVLTMTLPPNETVITEVGSFMFGSRDLQMNVELTLCTGGEGCQRICGGESCVKLLLVNDGSEQGVCDCLCVQIGSSNFFSL